METRGVSAIFYTDGQGRIARQLGSGDDLSAYAQWLDISKGVLDSGMLPFRGGLELAILQYGEATIVASFPKSGRRVAVLASAETNLGMLCNLVRRLGGMEKS